MSTLKKRSSAIIVALVVIILGTLFGVHRSIGSETAKIETLFYKGVYLKDEKYTQPSIQSLLDERSTAALGLVTIGMKYSEDQNIQMLTDSLREARLQLLDAKTIWLKFAANEKLQGRYKTLYTALEQFSLDDNALSALQNYASTLDGAQGVIQKSDYNRMVSEFRNNVLGDFPVNILKNLAFVKYPEYFGTEG